MYALSNAINACLTKVVYPYIGMTMVSPSGTADDMLMVDFKYHEGEIDYLVRIPLGWTPEMGRSRSNCVPIVYLHGLGFGLVSLDDHYDADY